LVYFYTVLFTIITTAYYLNVIRPTGITTTVPFPPLKSSGISIISPKKVYHHNEPIELRLNSTKNTVVQVAVFKHEIECFSIKETLEKGKEKNLQLQSDFYGVLRITVNPPLHLRYFD